MKKSSKSREETEQITKVFIEKILKNSSKRDGALVVGLSGDLGVGKTAFTQFAAKYLGIKEKVNSPTFVILKRYKIKKSPSDHKQMFHIDAYRLKSEKDLLNLKWVDLINNKENLIFIEWPENVIKVMPKNAFFIYLSHGKNNTRILELK